MANTNFDKVRKALEEKKEHLNARLGRIKANVRRGYHPDSKERAKELEDIEVVDALGNEARREISLISRALQRIDAGEFGVCVECGLDIDMERLRVQPYADECIECAQFDEKHGLRQN